MSNDTVKISPIGAFSHHWNQAIDNNKNFLVRLGKSVLEFIKATFCGYKVSAAMVSQPFLSEDGTHRNSIFSKEYRKKLDDRPVVILSPTIDLASLIRKGEYKSDDIRFSSKNLSTLSENELLHLMELAISIENGDLVGRLLYTVSYTALKNLSSILRGNILSLVVDAGREHDVRYILDCTIVEFDEENNGSKYLCIAATKGHNKCLHHLLEQKAMINAKSDGQTALHRAISANKFDSMRLLLNHKDIDINEKNDHGDTPIHLATLLNNTINNTRIVLELLESHKLKVNLINNDGQTPLDVAENMQDGPIKNELTHLLINNGAKRGSLGKNIKVALRSQNTDKKGREREEIHQSP